jgi:hypothetical protein
MSDSPSNEIPYVPQDTTDPAAGLNLSIDVIDALLNTRVIDMTHSAPPGGTPSDGDMYMVKATGTGAWAGHNNAIARYVAASNTWKFFAAGVQAWLFINQDDGNLYRWFSGSWSAASGVGDAPMDGLLYARRNGNWQSIPQTSGVESVNGETPDSSGNIELTFLQSLVAACSDESTALTTGTAKVTFRNPYATAFHITHVKASLTTAQATGSVLTVDINEAGASILSTKLTFDNTEKTTESAATPPVVSDNSIAADAEITVDIDQVGDGTAKGLKVYIIGYPL